MLSYVSQSTVIFVIPHNCYPTDIMSTVESEADDLFGQHLLEMSFDMTRIYPISISNSVKCYCVCL